jgi:hypothetical protein
VECRDLSSTRPPISRTPKCRNDGTWICCHLSSEMDGSQSSRDFAICDVGISRIGVLESSLLRSSNSRSPILRWDKIDGSRSISIQRSRMTRDFAIREFSRQSSDLYTLRVSEMPRSRHVSLDGRSR